MTLRLGWRWENRGVCRQTLKNIVQQSGCVTGNWGFQLRKKESQSWCPSHYGEASPLQRAQSGKPPKLKLCRPGQVQNVSNACPSEIPSLAQYLIDCVNGDHAHVKLKALFVIKTLAYRRLLQLLAASICNVPPLPHDPHVHVFAERLMSLMSSWSVSWCHSCQDSAISASLPQSAWWAGISPRGLRLYWPAVAHVWWCSLVWNVEADGRKRLKRQESVVGVWCVKCFQRKLCLNMSHWKTLKTRWM